MKECTLACAGHHAQSERPTAKIIFTQTQKIIILLTAISLILYLLWNGFSGLVHLNLAIHIFYVLTVGLKFALVLASLKRHKVELPSKDEELPTYCAMLPCYKEAAVIPQLINNINNLDYPKEKLQVLIVVEDDDWETLNALAKVNLPPNFEVFLVPTPLNPKGKPNSCNHALKAVKADFLVIYDAEDRPEPDQLKKAVKRFKELPEDVVCLQGKLNYFNRNENWLTKFFTIEYTTWFDFFIYGLSKLKLPIPLGGTTNHIKVKVLKEVGGWDEYNVTEDCDLGLRLASLGYKVDYLESTTYEEACMRPWAWVKQRTRWTKGYMITWLVHMRNPINFFKKVGLRGFVAVQLFVLGTPLVNLINPVLYGLFFSWLLFDPLWIKELFPLHIWYMGISLLVIGNLTFISVSALAVARRKYFNLIPWCVILPVYWMMQAMATYRALYQLIFDPYTWEKTEHGLTKTNCNNQLV